MIFKNIKEATLWSETTTTLCREVTEPNIEATMRSSGGLTSSGMTLLMRKTFSDFTQALTIRTRGPVEPVVGAESRNIMQGEAKRATSAPTGNPWTYQWCKPCHAKTFLLRARERNNPNPWTSGTRGRSLNLQDNAGRGNEDHILAHG